MPCFLDNSKQNKVKKLYQHICVNILCNSIITNFRNLIYFQLKSKLVFDSVKLFLFMLSIFYKCTLRKVRKRLMCFNPTAFIRVRGVDICRTRHSHRLAVFIYIYIAVGQADRLLFSSVPVYVSVLSPSCSHRWHGTLRCGTVALVMTWRNQNGAAFYITWIQQRLALILVRFGPHFLAQMENKSNGYVLRQLMHKIITVWFSRI